MKHALIPIFFALSLASLPLGAEPSPTGPQTERRFPPLKVPAGFKATLFACDPLVEYPSVIAAGPRPGAIFVAYDYMTGLGTEIVRRDEIRLVEDTDGDGYADKATVYATGFNSIMGLAYHDGAVYVMHAPYLTVLRDTSGSGAADQRKDLLTGLGLEPEKNPVRLHCANGVTVGHDGWLYLAMGDNGTNVLRPEGDRLVLNGGGILRCRPDGRDLHVFASGLRNIYDVALDAELNVFVRDNENDGGTYKIRVCHSFHGADHGYPYLYEERPAEALAPLADLGLGSSAGVACYLERQFPAEYRGNLFCCEWGKSIVRYPLVRSGGSFATPKEDEFAAGAPDDSYGFKPTDVVVQRDGTLMVSDWADGQRPLRGRGRIYTLAYVGERAPEPINGSKLPPVTKDEWFLPKLDSESYAERCDAQLAIEAKGDAGLKLVQKALSENHWGPHGRRHAIWILANLKGVAAIGDLSKMARSDAEPSVRAQAVRAIADLSDPVLAQHKLDAGPGDAELAAKLAELGQGQPRAVLLEVMVALGRLQWRGTVNWLKENFAKSERREGRSLQTFDAAVAHAAQQAIRRCDNWPAVLRLLDMPSDEPLRAVALRAIAQQYDGAVVAGLIERLASEADASRRGEYADALTRVYQKPAAWVYWGYRPAPRPANSVSWESSEAISAALNRTLAESDGALRIELLKRMQREKVHVSAGSLAKWLKSEHEPEQVATLLVSLKDRPAAEVRPLAEGIVRDAKHSPANRLAALAFFLAGLDETSAGTLLTLAEELEGGPVQADALRRLAKYPNLASAPLLVRATRSSAGEVRAAAVESLGELRADEGRDPLSKLLSDPDARVRSAAAAAAGKLPFGPAVEPLLKCAADDDPSVRRAALESLRLLKEPRAIPLAVAALPDRRVDLSALECLSDLGGVEQAGAVVALAKHNPSADVLLTTLRALTSWQSRDSVTEMQRQELSAAMAEIQGAAGVLVRWNACGPLPEGTPADIERQGFNWETRFAVGTEGRVLLDSKRSPPGSVWLAHCDLAVSEPTEVEFLASGSGKLEVWLNGKPIHRRGVEQPFRTDSDRFPAALAKGNNRLVLHLVPGAQTPAEFQIRFRRKSAKAEFEKLVQAALSRPGNAQRGKELFLNTEKSLCLKCHRWEDKGERTGPELTGVGGRFSRIYLAESILEPSRTIAPSFGTLTVVLEDGKSLSGIKVAETDATLTLADNQGQKHVLSKAAIELQRPSPLSTMPEGFEKRLTEEEFVDLISFLASQKEGRPP